MQNQAILFISLMLMLMLAGTILVSCDSMNLPPSPQAGPVSMNPLQTPDAKIIRDGTNQTILRLEGPNLSAPLETEKHFRRAQSDNNYSEIAMIFIDACRHLFLIDDPRKEFIVVSELTGTLGLSHVKLQQVYHEIEVADAQMIVHMDKIGSAGVRARHAGCWTRINPCITLLLILALS